MQDEERVSVGDQDVSSDFVPSDQDDLQVHWENLNVDMDAVSRPELSSSLSPSLFENFPVDGSAHFPIDIDDELDKENEFPQHPGCRYKWNRHL